MENFLHRIVENLLGRLDGPLHFRFILQPFMAVMFAVIDGIKDAKLGKPAHLWAIINNAEHHKEIIKDGWRSISKVFLLAVILDIIYQFKVLHGFYPLENLIVALFCALLPYVVLRGPVNRITRLFMKKT